VYLVNELPFRALAGMGSFIGGRGSNVSGTSLNLGVGIRMFQQRQVICFNKGK
jgi:hypothetical protein